MKKIFIIEDDEFNANILSLALSAKYSLSIVSDTIQMIEKINQFLPNLIITDNFVGQKVAAEIIAEIRAEQHLTKIPVVLLSGHPNIEKLAKDVAANAYLSKPFSLKDLNGSIENTLAMLESNKAQLS